jgi:hypothetical protein
LLKTRPALAERIGTEQRLLPDVRAALEEGFAEFLKAQKPDETDS